MINYHLITDLIIAITMYYYQMLHVTDTFLYLIRAFIAHKKKYHVYPKWSDAIRRLNLATLVLKFEQAYFTTCLKIARWVANSVDTDHSTMFDLALNCVFRFICQNTQGS